MASGNYAYDNPFRFSTKYADDETELLYYGYRYLSRGLARWVSRGPMGEEAALHHLTEGKQLRARKRWAAAGRRPPHLFVRNAPSDVWDALGLLTDSWQRCFDAYTGALDDEAKDALEDCLTECVGKGSWGAVGACIAGCATGRSAVYGARIACCGLGFGSETHPNPCKASLPGTRENCQGCWRSGPRVLSASRRCSGHRRFVAKNRDGKWCACRVP